jgi:hypothetical protein
MGITKASSNPQLRQIESATSWVILRERLDPDDRLARRGPAPVICQFALMIGPETAVSRRPECDPAQNRARVRTGR